MLLAKAKEVERHEFELFGPPHPGEILREEVLPRLKLSRRKLGAILGVSQATTANLLDARRRLTPVLVARLAAATGTNALYWLVLQAHHDAWSLDQAVHKLESNREKSGRRSKSAGARCHRGIRAKRQRSETAVIHDAAL